MRNLEERAANTPRLINEKGWLVMDEFLDRKDMGLVCKEAKKLRGHALQLFNDKINADEANPTYEMNRGRYILAMQGEDGEVMCPAMQSLVPSIEGALHERLKDLAAPTPSGGGEGSSVVPARDKVKEGLGEKVANYTAQACCYLYTERTWEDKETTKETLAQHLHWDYNPRLHPNTVGDLALAVIVAIEPTRPTFIRLKSLDRPCEDPEVVEVKPGGCIIMDAGRTVHGGVEWMWGGTKEAHKRMHFYFARKVNGADVFQLGVNMTTPCRHLPPPHTPGPFTEDYGKRKREDASRRQAKRRGKGKEDNLDANEGDA